MSKWVREKNILVQGKSVNVNHLSFEGQRKANILRFDSEIISLSLLRAFSAVSLYDPFICKIQEGNEIVTLNCEVCQIISSDEIQVMIKDEETMGDKRKHGRYYVSINAVISDKDSLFAEYAIAKNLSIDGICLDCNEYYKEASNYLISLIISKEKTILVEGKIIRRKASNNPELHQYEYGIEFVAMDKKNLKKLKEYIQMLEDQDKQYI